MVTRAQLAQGRSRQRRDELLAAAIELFAEGGSRAVTHRAVARRAGLPSATTTYYFASIEDLLREALAAHMQQWMTDLEGLTKFDLGDLGVGLDDGTKLVSQVFGLRTPEVARLQLSIFLAATQDPALRDTATEALRSIEQHGGGRAVPAGDREAGGPRVRGHRHLRGLRAATSERPVLRPGGSAPA